MIDKVKDYFGARSTSVMINGHSYPFLNKPEREVRFCEAVHYSFNLPIEINDQTLSCPGARRTFGYDNQGRDLVKMISDNTGIPKSQVNKALNEIPVFDIPVENIILGVPADLEEELMPDVYIAYTHPHRVMDFIHHAAQKSIKPVFPPYSIHSICGNIFSRAYHNQEITISFGCPESRNFGGVGKDEAIVGIPQKMARNLFK